MTKSLDKKIDILAHNTVDLISKEDFRKKLEAADDEGRPLRVKLGADPSAPDIHLGHVVVLNKLREFQDFGHTVVFIIGDFTGMIGDPSGRSQTRKPLSHKEVAINAKTYQEQIFKILDPKKTELRYNSEWCSPLGFADVLKLTSHCTVAQMLARDDFAKRFAANQSISLVEFMYPLVQAYDSVKMAADIEIGGTDQLFNLLVGRELQKAYGQQPQVVMTFPLLEGLDGVQKMSKSLNNYVGITEESTEVFGKVMSISDDLMWRYFALVLCMRESEIDSIKKETSSGQRHPREVKDFLAQRIVEKFHGKEKARLASDHFSRVFSERKLPAEIPHHVIDPDELTQGKINIVSLLIGAHLVTSKSEARRLVQQGGVRIDDERIDDPNSEIDVKQDMVLRAGKRKFVKLSLE